MRKLDGKTTMTVSELREKLNEFPQDMPVFATWEGVLAGFKAENFSLDKFDGEEILEIDVEDYWA